MICKDETEARERAITRFSGLRDSGNLPYLRAIENCYTVGTESIVTLWKFEWCDTPEEGVLLIVHKGYGAKLRLSTGIRSSDGKIRARGYGDDIGTSWEYYQLAKTENGKLIPADPNGWLE